MRQAGRFTMVLAAALVTVAAGAQDKPAAQPEAAPVTATPATQAEASPATQPAAQPTAQLAPAAKSKWGELPPEENLVEALAKGRLLLNLRPRVEWVDQSGKSEDALAFTNRTLLGWQTAPWKGLSATAQMINVAHFNDSFNTGPAASPVYPTVADPTDTDINQLFLDYTGLPDTRIRLGKQSLKLDNVRYVGNVEFRQVMQVFTGVLLENKSLPGLELNYAYFNRIKNIFAQQSETDINLFRAGWTWKPDNVLVGFAYFQDQPNTFQNTPAPPGTGFSDNSNRIVGVRATGAWPMGNLKALYTAEYSQQNALAGGNANIDASYTHLGAGVGFGKSFVRLEYELLGSNNGLYGFQTPLGTNHLFQGWADQFLITPKQGIQDVYLAAGTTVMDVQLYTELHDFHSDFGSIHYGRELDFGATYLFMKKLTGKLEFAVFDAAQGGGKVDTSKVWLTLIYQW